MFDPNDVVLSTRDAATLSAVLATCSLREELLPGAADELADKLASARVVAERALAHAAVALNARVTYLELPSGARRTVRLVHPASADASKALVSVFAPVGRALLGLRVGSRVPVALPDSTIDELQVIAVEAARRHS